MAPPQQAGKFRPRKPANRVRPGGSAGATPIAVGSSTSAGAAASAQGGGVGDDGGGRGGDRGRGRGRGGRDGGRGGDRGRGRGRGGRDGGRGGGRDGGRGRGGRGRGMPIQQGSAFFTAAPVPAKTSAVGTAGLSKTAAAVARRLQTANGGPAGDDELPQEEIVGIMEEAIGGPGPDGSKSKNRILDRENTHEQQGAPGADKKQSRFMEDETGYTYDSDSSRENKGKFGMAFRKTVTPDEEPLQLPFPSKKNIAPGIGHDYHPQDPMDAIMDDDDDDDMVPLAATSAPQPTREPAATHTPSAPIAITASGPTPSPFVNVNQKEALDEEKQSWFLVQFPTRLPPLRSSLGDNANADTAAAGTGGDEEEQAALNQTMKLDTAEVATPPVRLDCFDNAMSSAMAGRMGKIKIYKSGKTVLVLTAPDGTQTNFHVTQGLPCVFQQQAAIFDMDHSNMVQLGKVGKTLVVTPDLDSL